MKGHFILYLRDSKNSPFHLEDEYDSLGDLVSVIWCYELYENGLVIDEQVTKLVFDLLEYKCSRSELWEVYYVFRSV